MESSEVMVHWITQYYSVSDMDILLFYRGIIGCFMTCDYYGQYVQRYKIWSGRATLFNLIIAKTLSSNSLVGRKKGLPP